MEPWHLWIIFAILLLIVEIFSPAFLAATLALGCIAAGVVSAFDYGIEIQLIAFAAASLAVYFTVRPFMISYAYKKNGHVRTNADALVGKVGRVLETIDNDKNEGRIMVSGDDWKAESADDSIIEAGHRVEVTKVNSTILIVKHYNQI